MNIQQIKEKACKIYQEEGFQARDRYLIPACKKILKERPVEILEAYEGDKRLFGIIQGADGTDAEKRMSGIK